MRSLTGFSENRLLILLEIVAIMLALLLAASFVSSEQARLHHDQALARSCNLVLDMIEAGGDKLPEFNDQEAVLNFLADKKMFSSPVTFLSVIPPTFETERKRFKTS